MNLVKGKVVTGDGATIALADGSQARLSNIERPLTVGEEVTIGIRPEHMSTGSAGLVPLTGTVDVVERLGEASYVYMHLADGTNITLRIPGDSAVEPGAPLTASATAGAVHLFGADGLAIAHVAAAP
jgi:multiple sugar transport system ATP-binding protein